MRLIPPSGVKPFALRGETDAPDAFCAVVTQPTRRFAPVRTEVQRAVHMIHRTRDVLVRQTPLPLAFRAHFDAFGPAAPKAVHDRGRLMAEAKAADLPAEVLCAVDLALNKAALRGLGSLIRDEQ